MGAFCDVSGAGALCDDDVSGAGALCNDVSGAGALCDDVSGAGDVPETGALCDVFRASGRSPTAFPKSDDVGSAMVGVRRLVSSPQCQHHEVIFCLYEGRCANQTRSFEGSLCQSE